MATASIVDKSNRPNADVSNVRCDCSQFDSADPAHGVPTEQDKRRQYIDHGAIQPKLPEFPKSNGRTFRHQWIGRPKFVRCDRPNANLQIGHMLVVFVPLFPLCVLASS